MLNKSFQGKLALITGASSGIGEATARYLAAKGLRVILVARRLELLSKIAAEIQQAGYKADVIDADLSREEERERVSSQVTSQFGSPDILINNAGYGWYGYYDQMNWKTARGMLQVNVEAAMHLILLLLPGMHKRGSGQIVNVSSIAGSLPVQGIALYASTKAFLDAFSTSLYRELRGTGIHVSLIKPGPVISDFFKTARNQPSGNDVPAANLGITTKQVAARIWALIQRPRRLMYVPAGLGITPWIAMTFGWFLDLLGPIHLKNIHPSN